MLQTACMSPELLVNQNMSESEICGYSPGQGSPLPGETASPKSCFQQSPSLPDSGLTELNVASPKIYHPPPPPCKPPGMPAPADSELSSDPPQKRYMGVRVKMPVRELLRKIRLSKGLDVVHGKEASSVKMVTKGSSGKTAEKRRAHPYTEKQLRQSKQNAGQSPKGLEDLDILVEVLQEDLNKSQLREEPLHPVPDGAWLGFSRDPQSSRWERAASKEAAGDPQGLRQRSSAGLLQEPWGKDFHPIPQGRQRSSAGLLQEPWGKDFHPILRAEAELSLPGEQGSPHGCSLPGMLCRTAEQGSGWWVQDALPSSQEGFPRDFPAQDVPALLRPAEMLLEAPGGSPDAEGHSRLAPMSFPQQDPSAFSFFQFQLRREESLLRSIPAEKLLAPDENGNRSSIFPLEFH